MSFPYSSVTFIVIFVAWEAAVRFLAISPIILPAPTAVFADMVVHWRDLALAAGTTTWEILLGFTLSILIAVPLAIMLTSSRAIEKAIYPVIIAAQTIPKIAIAPVLLAWFGFGLRPKIIIVILIAFFPIVINSVVGMKSLSTQTRNLARSMGATWSQIFWRFQLPNALPSIFAGMKVATTLAIIGAIVAEFVGADSGLGYMMMLATSELDMAREFAAITILTVIGIIFFAAIEWTERLVLPWHVSIRSDRHD